MAHRARIRLYCVRYDLSVRAKRERKTKRQRLAQFGLSTEMVFTGRAHRARFMALGVASVSFVSPLLQFLQRDVRIAGRADHHDALVLSHRRRDPDRRRNQL